ncbi:MAG TPA: glycosyl hydrolase family 28-related protein, partial [Gemmatimonadales bacterium]|nr:glycosyl hydrolase family 28-related protein [Gemmatimonadales bacterium]
MMDRRSMLGVMGAAGAAFAGREGLSLPFQAGAAEGINVMEHGARGDGTHDDTDAIQRAIDASKAGRPVVLPAARYRIRKTIVLHDETVVLGYGRHSILVCSEPGVDAVRCEAKRVFLEGLSLDGDQSNRDGLIVHDSDDVRVRRCWFKGMGGRGLVVDNAPCVIMDSTIELCGGDGVVVRATNSGEPVHLVSCYIYHNAGHGVHFTYNANQ